MDFDSGVIVGRLVADPEKKEVGDGLTLTKFTIAKNRVGKDKDVADFFDVEAWRQTGDVVAAYVEKGNHILVRYHLKQDRWENEEGQKRSKIVLVADQVSLFPRATATAETADVEETESIPF